MKESLAKPARVTGECGLVVAAATERIASRIGFNDQCTIFVAHSPGGDVLMETALLRSPDLASRLAGALAPLDGKMTPLLETLVSFLESNQDRKVAAARLHIHPNTLIYRLQRIHDLTGLSPTVVKDVRKLWLAVAAWRLTRVANRGQFAS